MKDFVAKYEMTGFPHIADLDASVWRRFGVSAQPAFAFIGAAAFLATTMRAPFTALVLVVEFTQQGTDILIPSLLAVSGSVAVAYVLARRRSAQMT